MTASLVSILIPCYNAERWIAQSIQSALDQTYPNKEIIVLDDGSTDGSADVIESFGDLIAWERTSNRGANAARNRLTQLAQGVWLQYLDADDYLLPFKIASQMELVRERDGKADVIYSPIIVREDGKSAADRVTSIPGKDEAENLIRWIPFSSHGILLRREVVLKAGGWKENQICCQEHELLLRIFYMGSEFVAGNSAGAVYRRQQSDTISTRNPLRVIEIRMGLTDQLEEHLESHGNLLPAHRSALFVARMEAARSAFAWDREISERLFKKALASGPLWVGSSPALPWYYRLALSILGFGRTERLAVQMRQLRH